MSFLTLMFNTHNSYYAKFVLITNKIIHMKINYLVQYPNPVGTLVEDFLTAYQAKRLLKRISSFRWGYKLRINPHYNEITFVYKLGSFYSRLL